MSPHLELLLGRAYDGTLAPEQIGRAAVDHDAITD
jgi:hypothetical protein